jgi:hypothetical protein
MKFVPLALIAALAASQPALPVAAAAPSGFAYDSVLKFQPGQDDPSTLVPGDFAADFAAASQVAKPASGGGGLFGLGKMMAGVQSAMAIFKTGVAAKHYIAGSKERVDNPALQTATITDCVARTITTLDLAKKTYTVVSMDQAMKAATGGTKGGKPTPAATPDDTKFAVAVVTKALGSKTVADTPTSAYDTDMHMTATKPTGETSSTDMSFIGYYTSLNEPTTCPGSPFGKGATSGPAAAMMAQYALAMQAMKTSKGDPRFTVSAAGPPVPSGKFSMLNVFAIKGEQGKGQFDILDERGNPHAISASDPAFFVPADFTKVDSAN